MNIRSPSFGKEIRNKLHDLGITQAEIAKKLKVAESYLSDILSNKRNGYWVREKIVNIIEDLEKELIKAK